MRKITQITKENVKGFFKDWKKDNILHYHISKTILVPYKVKTFFRTHTRHKQVRICLWIANGEESFEDYEGTRLLQDLSKEERHLLWNEWCKERHEREKYIINDNKKKISKTREWFLKYLLPH